MAQVILTDNLEVFGKRYGARVAAIGAFQNGTRLSSSGGTLQPRSSAGERLLDTRNHDLVPGTDGGGYSLVANGTNMWQPSGQ